MGFRTYPAPTVFCWSCRKPTTPELSETFEGKTVHFCSKKHKFEFFEFKNSLRGL